jgi:hypothetical protein
VLVQLPVLALVQLPVLVLVRVEPTWQVAPVRPPLAGPVPERQPGGTERGASSRPEAWPASRAPEAGQAVSGGQPSVGQPSGGQLRRPTKPPQAEPARRSQRHGRACGLGLESAQLESGQKEACVPDRLRAPGGPGRGIPRWPRTLGWPTPVHDRRPARDWLLGTRRLPGTGSAEAPGEGAATGWRRATARRSGQTARAVRSGRGRRDRNHARPRAPWHRALPEDATRSSTLDAGLIRALARGRRQSPRCPAQIRAAMGTMNTGHLVAPWPASASGKPTPVQVSAPAPAVVRPIQMTVTRPAAEPSAALVPAAWRPTGRLPAAPKPGATPPQAPARRAQSTGLWARTSSASWAGPSADAGATPGRSPGFHLSPRTGPSGTRSAVRRCTGVGNLPAQATACFQ